MMTKGYHNIFQNFSLFFIDTTIRDLFKIANQRKETRHYEDSKTRIPHNSIKGHEAEQFFQRVDVLALSVVRNRLGLTPLNIVYL